MIQAGYGLCFALKALLANWIRGALRRENLDRDGSLQPRVAGTIHLSRSVRAQRREDFIRA
jgi:hypothetical protein